MAKRFACACVVFFLLGIPAALRGQSILTVAGGGPIGDGQAATSALLKLPNDVATDKEGNVYIADGTNFRIRRVDAQTGRISTFAGGGTSGPRDGGPAVEAELGNPSGIALDSAGNVYVAEGARIRKVERSTGIITTYAGGGNNPDDGVVATEARITAAGGFAFDSQDNLYFAEGSNRIRKIAAGTRVLSTVAGGRFGFSGDGGPATAAAFDGLRDVAVDRAGNLYVPDSINGRIRKVDATTGIVTTIAGTGERKNAGDGGPASQAAIFFPSRIAIDSSGNLFLSVCCGSVRRIDAASGLITLAAGAGAEGFGGDGGPAAARDAQLNFPADLHVDSGGNLLIADHRNHRIRKVSAAAATLSTIAGGGPIGDNGPATSAQLFAPFGIALDNAQRNLFIADQFNYRVRKLALDTGTITTVAGTGNTGFGIDAGIATAASFLEPWDVAVDRANNLYFIHRFGAIRKVDLTTGIMTTIAGTGIGGYSGDNGPATQAMIDHAQGLGFDRDGNLYIADTQNHLIRKINTNGIITTIAGTPPPVGPSLGTIRPGTFSGDGGAATAAGLNQPRDVALDNDGHVFLADFGNNRIRRIDAATGTITTVAGGGTNPRDGIAATETALQGPNSVAFDTAGNLLIADGGRVRRVDLRTGIVSTVAGTQRRSFDGDGGPALNAALNDARGVVMDREGSLFVSDGNNNRIRAVFACRSVSAPNLTAPAEGATGVGVSPTLAWERVPGAFRYDVVLSTLPDGTALGAADLTATSFTPSNLVAGTTYYWRVVAKGDPFCSPVSTASSPTRSFTTTSGCDLPGAFDLGAPADGASAVGVTTDLTWTTSAGAGTYDVLLGTTNPPGVVASVKGTSYTATTLAPGTTYFWAVVAHASCDGSKVRRTPIRSFRTGGACPAPGAFNQVAPLSGARDVPTGATLEWSPSPNATSYDLFLGTTNPPPVYLLDLTSTRINISGFAPGQTYFWRVAAKVGCDPSRAVSTPVANFTIRSGCSAPQTTSFTFTPSTVAAGQTYVVGWKDAADLEPSGYYVIERSLSESFSAIADAQETQSTAASFVAAAPGTYYHRVRAVNPCNANGGTSSAARGVSIVPAPANVVFTVQPEAVLTTLGDKLEDKKSRFLIENIGSETATVILGRQEIDSPPFFTIADPFGGDSSIITLDPRRPKELEIRYSGPPNDKAASYQGVIFLASVGKGLAITPYAFVNLRVGGSDTATPEFRVRGIRSEYAFFPGRGGDDATRDPITVEIFNSGTTPMELGAEIGPELWLIPEAGWNSTAIPPGASRSVKLFTRRTRAPNGSALPRYTYFNVRSKTGRTARLLVQDNDAPAVASGRGSALDPSVRSVVIPEVVSGTAYSVVRLSNVGPDVLTAELFFTPAETDGFSDTGVRRATVVIPGNDVVTLTDPVAQLWGLNAVAGQLEIRTAPERIGQLTARALTARPASAGGLFTYTVPSFGRGEGARNGLPHEVAGVTTGGSTRGSLVIAETSGVDRVAVRAVLYDGDGNTRGERSFEVLRYGYVEITDLLGAEVTGGRVELTVTAGGGAAAAIVKLLDPNSGGGATLVGRAAAAGAATPAASRRATTETASRTFLLPVVVNDSTFQTTVGLAAGAETTTFQLTYTNGAESRSATVTVPAKKTTFFRNILEQSMALPAGTAADGSITINANGGDVFSQLAVRSSGPALASVSQALPVIRTDSESVTSSTSQRLLYLDGLDQSIDPTRGTRWALLLNEVSGRAASVIVSLYEAGNRTSPIAQKEFVLPARARLKMNNLFADMGLESNERRKDRANMLMSIVTKSGSGAATAVAMSFDNKTGDSRSHVLSPASGGGISVQKASIVGAPAPTGRKRRAAGR